jgi:putative flippase GtrA
LPLLKNLMQQIAQLFRSILLYFKNTFKIKFLTEQTYLYAACGGLNLLWDLSIRFVVYHFILHGQILVTSFYTFSPDIASFLVAFPCSFVTGFFMSKYVVWTQSNLKGRKQLARYFMVVMLCFALNVGFIKLFSTVFGFYFLPSALLAAVFVIATSYLLQRFFSFKVKG